MTWPYPGDGPVARARRVAHAYRERLLAVNPDECARLDAAMAQWGQRWAMPRVVTVDVDDWLPLADAADLAMVAPATLRQWRRRGKLAGRRTDEGWEYKARDVLRVAGAVGNRRQQP